VEGYGGRAGVDLVSLQEKGVGQGVVWQSGGLANCKL
jgi:hypothetical protein